METVSKLLIIIVLALFFPLITEVKSYPSDIWTTFSGHVSSVVDRIIPTPVKNFFSHENEKNVSIAVRAHEQGGPSKERGQFETFGHEVVKRIGKAFTSIGNKLGITSTKGLDVNKNFFSGIATNFKEHIRVIYPGTLWCGDGDVAKSRRALGYFYLTDECCREHDSCNDYIPAGETRYGLENSGLFTRSNCECDYMFRNCLKKANTIVANKIGFTYFTILGPQCFKVEYPVVTCKATSWRRCIDYEVDTSREPRLQWFDNPIY